MEQTENTEALAAGGGPGLPPAEEPKPFTWRPLYEKLVVRRAKPKETYDDEGFVKVAEVHQQLQNYGTVIAVGEGRLIPGTGEIRPLRVQVGSEVLFGKHSGTALEEDDELVMLREDELLAWR